MMRRLLERWKPRLSQAGVRTHTAFDASAGIALADPRTLEQVVVNLLTNALQAMTQGGTLSVTVAPSVDGQAIDVEVADTAGHDRRCRTHLRSVLHHQEGRTRPGHQPPNRGAHKGTLQSRVTPAPGPCSPSAFRDFEDEAPA
jgi:hypothetical protein